MLNFFPKAMLAFLYFIILVAGISILIDVGNMFLVESRGQYVARNANIYVSKFAVNETQLSEFNKGTLSEDDVKKVLEEYFTKQYKGFHFQLKSSEKKSGTLKLVYEPTNAINSRSDGEYSHYGTVTVRAVFKNFGSGSGGTVSFQIEQKMPLTLRGFLESQFKSGLSGYGVLNDSENKFGYYYVKSERAFRINTLDKAY